MEVNAVRINITNYNNAAMVDDRGGETIRILQQIINNITEYGVPNCDGMRLMDTNGNQVGTVLVEMDNDDDDDDDDDDDFGSEFDM